METAVFPTFISDQIINGWINKKEISVPRIPKQFINWFEEKLELVEHLKPDLRKQNLLHKGIAKVFYEELFPLYRLLQNKIEAWNDVELIPILGEQNFDVKINNSKDTFLEYIEITQAGINEYEYLRRVHLSKYGYVNMIGEVLKEGPQKAGLKISIRNELISQDELNSRMINHIKDAIEKKQNVRKRPNKTALLVYFDDYRTFLQDKDWVIMNNFLDSICNLWLMNYVSLFVVGASGRRFCEKVLVFSTEYS